MWFPESANLRMVPTLHLGFAAEWFGFVLTGFFLDKSGPEALLQLCNTDAPSLQWEHKDPNQRWHSFDPSPPVWGTRLKSNLKSYPLRPATCGVHIPNAFIF